ncbi:hypothetical protein [Dehalococcoides sp. THU4]|uniref:hypothetical protein n=1 Tax=Dehalococcoides sp. THU4 TaxID=3348344 RepID=UPI0037212E41
MTNIISGTPDFNYEKAPITQEQLQREYDYVLAQQLLKSMLEKELMFILKPLLDSLSGISSDDSVASIRKIDMKLEDNAEQRKVLVSLMTKGYLEPAVYNKGNNELLQEAEQLQRQKESLVRFINSDSQNLSEVNELLRYTSKATMLSEFDGDIFNRFVDRIYVYSRSEIGFVLKCGITLKERLVN